MMLSQLSKPVRKTVTDRLIELLTDGSYTCTEVRDKINEEFGAQGLLMSTHAVSLFAWRRKIPICGARGRARRSEPPPEIKDEDLSEIVLADRRLQSLSASYHILLRKYQEALRQATLADAIRDTVREHIQALPVIPPPKIWTPSERHVTRESWVALFSDLHWGELIRPEEVMGFNWYDKDTATRRCELYLEVIADLALNHLLGYEFEEVYLFVLGDLCSGDIHEELRETNIGSTFDHIFEVAIVLTQVIRELLTFFPRVIIRFTDDNHGRWSQKARAKGRYINRSLEIAHIVSGLFSGEPRVEFRIGESAFNLDTIRGHAVLSMHGDTIKAWNQIPDYGIERADMRLSQLLGAHGLFYEYLVMAHFHTTGIRDRAIGQRIMNGCIKGGDEYSMTVLHTGGQPRQTVFGMHTRGRSFMYDLDLTTAPSEKPKRWTYEFRPSLGQAHMVATEMTADWLRQREALV